jgi:hypothetical protein
MIDCGCDEILLPQGSDGADGRNAFTRTTAAFTQPAASANVTINVSDVQQFTNQWAIPGQIIRITDSAGEGGWYEVVSLTGTTQITITNLDYVGSSIAGQTIATNAGVSPAGLQGPQGTQGNQGLQGIAGPSNVLFIPPGGVTTLPPGSPATVSISGSVPNQSLTFGIPQGFAGQTLHYYNYSRPAQTGVGLLTLIDSSTNTGVFPADTLCPNDGDIGRITFSCYIVGLSPESRRGIDFEFLLGNNIASAQTILPTVLSGNGQLALCPLRIPLQSDFNKDFMFVNAQILIKRLSTTTAEITLDWKTSTLTDGSYSRFYRANATTLGGLNFNSGSQIELKITALVIDDFNIPPPATPPAASQNVSIGQIKYFVEKITS